MNFSDFFRRAMGIPRRYEYYEDEEDPGRKYRHPDWDEEDDEEDEFREFRNVPSTPFGFHIFTGDSMDMHRYFEQQMDDMMKSFRMMEGSIFGSGLTELPDMLEPHSDGRHPTEESIRDRYLKPSYENRPSEAPKTDTDIDDRVNTGDDLSRLMPYGGGIGGGFGHRVPQRAFSHQSVVKKTIRLPDGRVEESQTSRSSDGKERTVVTRSYGDQTHSVTTVKDSKTGLAETQEEFINLDEGGLADFDKKWNTPGGGGGRRSVPGTGEVVTRPPSGNNGGDSGQPHGLIDAIMRNFFK